nr:MAG TPA: hypothetical protein [Caudoviricetes sp.]
MRVTTERWAINPERTEAIAAQVSERTGFVFADEEISRTIEYTKRKCELNGKGEDYFYLLFENELEDLIQRYYINLRGFINQLRKEEQRCAKSAT